MRGGERAGGILRGWHGGGLRPGGGKEDGRAEVFLQLFVGRSKVGAETNMIRVAAQTLRLVQIIDIG